MLTISDKLTMQTRVGFTLREALSPLFTSGTVQVLGRTVSELRERLCQAGEGAEVQLSLNLRPESGHEEPEVQFSLHFSVSTRCVCEVSPAKHGIARSEVVCLY